MNSSGFQYRTILLYVILIGLACTQDQPVVIEEKPIGGIVGIVKPIGAIADIVIFQGMSIDTTASDSATGFFEFKNLKVGFYTLEVKAKNYGRYVENKVEVVTSGITSVGEIKLRPMPEQIDAFLPANNSENILLDSPCGFVFTTYMDHNSVEHNFKISPSIQGYFEWNEGGSEITCEYIPTIQYQPATRYTFSLSRSAKTIYGDTLAFQVTSSFTTEPVRVQIYSPQDGASFVDPASSIYVKFNTDMNKSSVENAFRMVNPVLGQMIWHSSDAFSFQPDANLTTNRQYQVNISTNAKDVFNNSLGAAFSFLFTTEPLRVTYQYPANGATNIATDVSIQVLFNTTVDIVETEAAFTIFPKVEGTFTWTDLSKFTFRPSTPLSTATTYFITLSTGVQDTGGSTMPKEHTFNFRTITD
ncbi:Ig-like domain-containing protein [candidate division KSB1 bacterium]|nr:Ig-like domain-containing protein [candidate division KSB1 bacterium]